MYSFRLFVLAAALIIMTAKSHAAQAGTIECFFDLRAVNTPVGQGDYVQNFELNGSWNGTTGTLALNHVEHDAKLLPNGLYAIDNKNNQNAEQDIPATNFTMVNNNGANAAFAPVQHYADGNYYNPSFTIQSAAAAGTKGRFSGYFTVYQQGDDAPFKLAEPMICNVQ
jgi:hypothetical protein